MHYNEINFAIKMTLITKNNQSFIEIIGFGLARIKMLDLNNEIEIIYYKGIDVQKVKSLIEIKQSEILKKKDGILIDLFSNFTVYIHYFSKSHSEIIVIIYFDKKTTILNFSELFNLSKRLASYISENKNNLEIQHLCNKKIKIPKSNGVLAIYIINSSGHLFFSKINKKKTNLKEYEIQISGFITALSIFSKEIIGKEPQTKLKQINFGDKHFFVNLMDNVIFAFLVQKENITDLTKRYMRLISNEFLENYKEIIAHYSYDLSLFSNFEKTVDQYFIV